MLKTGELYINKNSSFNVGSNSDYKGLYIEIKTHDFLLLLDEVTNKNMDSYVFLTKYGIVYGLKTATMIWKDLCE